MSTPTVLIGRLRAVAVRRARWLLPLLVVVVSAGAYLNTLRLGFTFDDQWLILDNSRIDDPSYIRYLLIEKPLWRPLKRISLMADYAMWGRQPAGYHATNIALQTAACVALFFLILRLGRCRALAFLTSLLFALHPVHVESVANISHRKEPLSLLFQLLAFLAYLRARDEPPPWSPAAAVARRIGRSVRAAVVLARVEWLFVSGLCYLLGLLSKEVGAVMLPAMILVYELAVAEGSLRRRLRIAGAAFVPSGAVLLLFVYKGYLGNILKRFSPDEILWVTSNQTASYGDLLLRVLKSLALSVGALVWPAPLYLDRRFDQPAGIADALVLGGLLALVAYGVALVVSARRSRLAFFALCWLGFNWLPTSNIIPLTHWSFTERFLYVPSVGFALLVGLGLRRLYTGPMAGLSAAGTGRLATILTVAILSAYGVCTVRQNEIWRSQFTLWSHTLAHNPDSFRGLSTIGHELVDRRSYPEADALLERCIERHPAYRPCWESMAYSLLAQGRSQEALDNALAYAALRADDPRGQIMIGQARRLLGDKPGAMAAYRRSLEMDPEQEDVLKNLASMCMRDGNLGEALELVTRALALGADAATEVVHAQILTKLGRLEDAIASYRRALELDPAGSDGIAALARLLSRSGDVSGAIAVLEQAQARGVGGKAEQQLLDQLRQGNP